MQSAFRKIAAGFMAIAFAAAMSTVSAQSKDVGMGTWALNVAKSKFNPGPAPKSLTAKFEPTGKGVKLTTQGVGADGKPTATEYTANYDGKDYSLKGSAVADTVSLQKVDDWTTMRTDKKNGKTMVTYKRVVAKDGKTFTVDIKGTDPKGQAFTNMLVFERK